MDLVSRSSGNDASFDLGGDITITEAAELRDALALALATSQRLTLNLSGVETVDVAGLQVLLALVRESSSVSLVQPSETLQRAVDTLQIDCLQHAFASSTAGGES